MAGMLKTGYQDFLTALGRRIQVLRKGKGLSQERLAERLGMDRVSIGYVEQGRRSPRLSTLYAIADALDVRVIDLFEGIESELASESAPERVAESATEREPKLAAGREKPAPEHEPRRTPGREKPAPGRGRDRSRGRDARPEQEGPSLA